jgi:hypothetical protein
MGESAIHADVAAVLVQVRVTEPVPVFEVHVGVVLLNEAMPGRTEGELTGDGVTDFVGAGVGVFVVGLGVGFVGGAVVLTALLVGDGAAVTVAVTVAVTTAEGGAGVLAGVLAIADAVEGLAGWLDAGAVEAGAGLGGLLEAGEAWWEFDEHADSSTVIDAPATIARRHFMVNPLKTMRVQGSGSRHATQAR